MKVIVNDHTPLIVEDVNGNVLYEWQPEKKYIDVTRNKHFTWNELEELDNQNMSSLTEKYYARLHKLMETQT